MYFSHEKKFFFIHNVRTGGSSVEKALAPYLPWYLRSPVLRRGWARAPSQRPLGWERVFFVRKGHVTAAELKHLVPPEVFAGYFKFGFVRNPWDWHVSLYHYILRQPGHRQHHLIRSFVGFPEYVRWKTEMDLELQKRFFYDARGRCLVDYIGRFETLADDMAAVARKLGLGDGLALPRINASARSDWRVYYDDTTFDLIRHAYREDIRLFGYDREEAPPVARAAG